MKALHPIPQCVDCLLSLTSGAAGMAAAGNPKIAKKAEHAARKILTDATNDAVSSPQIANRILREIRRITGVSDPYEQFKVKEMTQARNIISRLIDHVGSDLQSRIRLAILGNSLDFFKNPEEALAEIPNQFRQGISFFYDDGQQLDRFLEKRPGLILYFADNAGEIYFDLPLYEYIRARCQKSVLVVKGGPSLNDLTRTELKLGGLEDKFSHVADTGTDGSGIDWDHVSQEFLDLVAAADLIVSKGMANFETIYPRELPAAVFFLFKVKCEPIQNYINAPANSYLALWRD